MSHHIAPAASARRRRPPDFAHAALLGGLGILACSAVPVKSTPGVHERRDTAPRHTEPPVLQVPAEPPSAAPDPGVEPVELLPEPVEPVATAAAVEVLAPIAEQLIPMQRVEGARLRMELRGAPAPGSRLWVALGEHPPRMLEARSQQLPLSALVGDGAALVPGEQWVVVALVDAQGVLPRPLPAGGRQPFAAVRFWLGERGAPFGGGVRPVLLAPRGTFNGSQADGVRLDFVLLGARPGAHRVEVRVLDDGDRRGTLLTRRVLDVQGSAPETPLRIRGLPSGDFLVRLDGEGGGAATAARVITVNRDLPETSEGFRP